MHYKVGQVLLQIGAAFLNYKAGQVVLLRRVVITKCGNIYCELGQVSQSGILIKKGGSYYKVVQ